MLRILTGHVLILSMVLAAASLHAGTITTITVSNLSLTEASSFNGTVATFTESNLTEGASNFSAVVNWGDGSASSGTVSGASGAFSISSIHTYADEGSFILSLTITDLGGAPVFGSGLSTIADAPLNVVFSLPSFVFTPGVAVSNVALGTFGDANSTSPPSDFAASINWGDGSVPSAATVTGGVGSFGVSGSHTYATSANFAVSTSITDDGGSSLQLQSLAKSSALTSVPEPGSMAMLLSGLALAYLLLRCRYARTSSGTL